MFKVRYNLLSQPYNKVIKIDNSCTCLRFIKNLHKIKDVRNINKINAIITTTVISIKKDARSTLENIRQL